MKKTIDCLFIGHNEMSFPEYEKNIAKMGTASGTYRDLNLNFITYKNRPYHVSEVFNLFCCNDDFPGRSIKPLKHGEIFSATIAYLGSYLNRAGFTFDYVISFQNEKEELGEKLRLENILSIAITTTYYVFALPILEIIHFIREYNHTAKIIIGGPFIAAQFRTQDPVDFEYLLEMIGADLYVNSSQGEAALVKIINSLKNNLSLDQINNIYYKTNDSKGYVSTPILAEDNKLSENMVNWTLFSNKIGEYVDIRTSISCPFSCAFCGFPEHAGRFQTAAAVDVEYELNHLQNIKSLKGISIIDDTLNIPQKRFIEILKMMVKNKYKFRWISNLRCQFVDREMVELMKRSGCEAVFLGLESGNNQILKNMNKSAAVERYLEGIALLKEYEILSFGSFVIGFPGETEKTIQDTIHFIEESGIDFYRTHLWYCDPITPIWREKEKYNLKGDGFEWSHETMDSKTACDWIYEIFMSIEKATWVPQYNFELDNLWHLMHRGLSLEQIKKFIRSFNEGIKEKISNPSQKEISQAVIGKLKNASRENNDQYEPVDHEIDTFDNFGVTFDF